eukprot:5656635-Pyramimonas_sp.AAC.1
MRSQRIGPGCRRRTPEEARRSPSQVCLHPFSVGATILLTTSPRTERRATLKRCLSGEFWRGLYITAPASSTPWAPSTTWRKTSSELSTTRPRAASMTWCSRTIAAMTCWRTRYPYRPLAAGRQAGTSRMPSSTNTAPSTIVTCSDSFALGSSFVSDIPPLVSQTA